MSIESAVERIHRLVTTRADSFRNEEAIKASLVMPFLAGLGNDPFDPDHVVAGYRSDAGKADFATIDDDGVPRILVCVTSTPDDVTSPRAKVLAALLADVGDIGLLTNGQSYRFHGLGSNRTLAPEPFMAFDLSEGVIEADILRPLSRGDYDIEAAFAAGRLTKLPELAYDTLLEQLVDGSDVHGVIASAIVPGGIASEASRSATAEAFARALRVLRGEEPAITPQDVVEEEENVRTISGDEEAAYQAVRRIASRYVDAVRIHPRPAQKYLAVLLDDNNRRTICRLYFSASSTRYIGTFSGQDETKQRITGFADVANFEDQIEARLRELDPGAFAVRRETAPMADDGMGADHASDPLPGADAGSGAEFHSDPENPMATIADPSAEINGDSSSEAESDTEENASRQENLLGDDEFRRDS